MNLPPGLEVALGVGLAVGDNVGVAMAEATALGEAEGLADAVTPGVGLAEFPAQPTIDTATPIASSALPIQRRPCLTVPLPLTFHPYNRCLPSTLTPTAPDARACYRGPHERAERQPSGERHDSPVRVR